MTTHFDRQAWLIQQGLTDSQGVTATPKLRHCSACGRHVWAAWANRTDDVITVDPIALTPLGELQALTAGRATYTHWRDGLDERRARWIRRIPATPTNIIRPRHECDTPAFEHYPSQKHPARENTTEIPY